MGIKFPFKCYHVTDTLKESLYTVSKLDNGKVRTKWTEDNVKNFVDYYTINHAEKFIKEGTWIVVEQPEEKPKHIHDAIIRAWLDGEQIQCRLKDPYNGDPVSDWYDLSESVDSVSGDIPGFNIRNEYRIKPKDPDVKVYFEVSESDTIQHAVVRHMKLSEAEKILDNLPK